MRNRAWWVLALVGQVACFSPDSSGSGDDAGSDPSDDAGPGARDGGSGPRDGGGAKPGDGGRDSGFHPPDATIGVDGGGASVCNLSPDTGPCDAAISRWAWNPSLGACELFSYGGCGGNGNNFNTPAECLRACAPTEPTATACKVGDQVFPDGAGGIDDPFSCNTCQCIDGQLACTEIGCPEECPPNAVPATSCAACGPADGCEVVDHGCFPVCGDSDDCLDAEYGTCFDGVCKNLCG